MVVAVVVLELGNVADGLVELRVFAANHLRFVCCGHLADVVLVDDGQVQGLPVQRYLRTLQQAAGEANTQVCRTQNGNVLLAWCQQAGVRTVGVDFAGVVVGELYADIVPPAGFKAHLSANDIGLRFVVGSIASPHK